MRVRVVQWQQAGHPIRVASVSHKGSGFESPNALARSMLRSIRQAGFIASLVCTRTGIPYIMVAWRDQARLVG